MAKKEYLNKKVTELTAQEAFDVFVKGTIILIAKIVIYIIIFLAMAGYIAMKETEKYLNNLESSKNSITQQVNQELSEDKNNQYIDNQSTNNKPLYDKSMDNWSIEEIADYYSENGKDWMDYFNEKGDGSGGQEYYRGMNGYYAEEENS